MSENKIVAVWHGNMWVSAYYVGENTYGGVRFFTVELLNGHMITVKEKEIDFNI